MDKWQILRSGIQKWAASAEDDAEWGAYDKVLKFMDELERVVSDVPAATADQNGGPWGYAEPWNFTEDQVRGWAQAALNGAPAELVDLCAKIAWSVLQGSNPDPDERAIHVESVKAVAGLFSNDATQGGAVLDGEGLRGTVTGGIVG